MASSRIVDLPHVPHKWQNGRRQPKQQAALVTFAHQPQDQHPSASHREWCYAPRREPRFGCWRCSSLIVATTAVSRATGGVEELAVSKKSWILRWSPGTLGTSAGMTFTKYLQAPLSDNQAEKLMILMMFTQAFASCWKPSRPWHLRKSTNRRKMFLTLSPAAVGACLPTCPPTCHCSLAVDWWASREKPS